jgi:NADH-quinone oxidoreductase subunit C
MASTITPDFITQKLQEKFGDDIQLVELPYGFPTYTVAKKAVYDVVAFLKNDPALSFQFLTTMCGLHYPNTNKDFGLMLQLHNLPENVQVRIKCFTDEVNPSFKTFTTLWPAANWMEREAYDFFGFNFEGHPDLRRILNMDSLEGWPLRKEFPLEDPFRRDKDDKMFGR